MADEKNPSVSLSVFELAAQEADGKGMRNLAAVLRGLDKPAPKPSPTKPGK